jgi:hypothetical protein
MKPPIVAGQPVPVGPEDGLRRLLGACAAFGGISCLTWLPR